MKTRAQGVGQRWAGRPFASAAVRTLVLLVPVTVGVVAGVVTARLLPRPTGAAALIWWAVVLGTSTLALYGAERLARRVLPLAALLRLTLVFPDKAPSRFAVAFRSRSARSLAAWATDEAAADADDDPGTRATAALTLAAALNAHDRRTRGHSERVRVLSLILGEEMGLSDDNAARLGWAALLHDIGKLTVPTDILNKPGTPDAHEWRVLRRHPASGACLARPLDSWLGGWIAAIGQHHENWDGSGYPDGLAGDDIGLSARIVSVTDSFETMTALRSYKKPVSVESARRELERCAGSQFDPAVVRAFFNISLGSLTWTTGVAAWLAQLPFIGVLPRAGAAIGSFGGPAVSYSGALAGAGAVTVSMVIAVGGPVLTKPAASPGETTGGGGGGGGGGHAPHAVALDAGDTVPDAIAASTMTATAEVARTEGGTESDVDDGGLPLGVPSGVVDGVPPGLTGGVAPGQGGTPPGLDGDVPPGHGDTTPGLIGGLPPVEGGPPPGLDGDLTPGQGGTPPGLDGDASPGHGDTPLGQKDKDWSDHPQGGPPGQQKKNG